MFRMRGSIDECYPRYPSLARMRHVSPSIYNCCPPRDFCVVERRTLLLRLSERPGRPRFVNNSLINKFLIFLCLSELAFKESSLKSAYVPRTATSTRPGHTRSPNEMLSNCARFSVQTVNCPDFMLVGLFNSRRDRSASSQGCFGLRADSILDVKLPESSPSFPIIRHELAPGPAHPLITYS